MAGYIKGITIEFGANTQKLNKALNNLQTKLNKTQNELKQVNRALKFNPRNATLLKQKFDLLSNSVTQTEKKLKGLRAMQNRMDNNKVDQNSAAYRELQREIIKTEDKLKQAQNELKKFGTIGQQQAVAVGNKMKSLGASMTGIGRSLTTHLSLPLTLAGGMAGRVAADFDSAMSKVQAISGATGAQFDALRDKAREMGAKTKFSATESAEALTYMAMAGWKSEDMLDGLEGIMNLAAASGEDLATTSDIVTDALTAFGLSAEDSAHFADILAAASSNANTNVGMMGETFRYAAPIAGALGYTAEDTALAIGLMANAGIKSSQAGTSLRNIMTKLSHDFTISGDAIGDVTIATTNADGSMRSLSDILGDARQAFSGLTESEKAATAESLVGRNAMSGFLALMNASPKDVKQLEDALANADGAAEQMSETMMDNFGGQLTILKSQLAEAGIAIGDTLVPFMEKLVAVVQKLVDWFNSLSPTAQRIIVVIGMIAVAIGPIITAIGLLVTAIGGALTFAPVIMGAAGAVAGAIGAIAGPVLGVIAIIAGLVAGGIALYRNWDTIKAKAQEVWASIQNAVAVVVGRVKTNFNTLKTALSSAWNAIKTTASTVWDGIKTAITKPIQTAINTVKTLINKIKGFFPLKIGKIINFKTPSISLNTGSKSVLGKTITYPKGFSVSWHKKAMNDPYLFNQATLFGAGEAGDEVLYGRRSLMNDIASASGGGEVATRLASIEAILDYYLPRGQQIVMDNGVLIGQVNRGLGMRL